MNEDFDAFATFSRFLNFTRAAAEFHILPAGGKVALDAPPAELRDGERLRDVYFGRAPSGS